MLCKETLRQFALNRFQGDAMARPKKRRQTTSFSKRLLYWGSHLLCGAAVIVAFLTLVQCTIKKPEAPSWDTNITVPMTNKTWNMSELIEKIDQNNLTIDSLGNPTFYYQHRLDTVAISGDFTLPEINQAIAESLGLVTLAPMAPTNFSVTLISQFPGLPAGTFPDTSFTIIQAMPTMTSFNTATIVSGFSEMVIDNDFGLDLDTVIVTIYDDIASQQVTTYQIPGGIPAGSMATDTIDLSGKTVSNQLSTQIHCHALQQTSFSLADKSMSSAMGMPDGLTVSSATALMPQMSKSYAKSVEVGSSHQVESAVLDSGRLILDFSNNTNMSVGLTITLPDFVLGGSPLVINRTIYAQQGGQYYYNLAGYALEPADQVMPQELDINVEALIASSSGSIVTIDAGDAITVNATIDNIKFGPITGIIAPTTADFDSVEQTIDIPTGFENMQLPSATLVLEIENSVNIPGSFSVSIDGDQGQHKAISGTIQPGLPGNPVTTVFNDTNLTAFMAPMPETFTITGSATFGDGVTSGIINSSDFVVATVTISSPMEMIIDSSVVDGEWADTDLDIDSSVVNSFKSASFYADFENHLPLGVAVEILLSGDSATLYSNPQVRLGPVTVESGEIGPDGTVSAATVSQTVLSMDAEDIQVLHSDTLWIGEVLTLLGSDGATVRMSASDYLTIVGYIDLSVNFSDDLWGDN